MAAAYPHSDETILPSLLAHLPQSLPLTQRIQNQNHTTSSVILATFPPDDTPPDVWTTVYVDRTRRGTSQAWIYCSVERQPELGNDIRHHVAQQLLSILQETKKIPPNDDNILLIASVSDYILKILQERYLTTRHTGPWRKYLIQASSLPKDTNLPSGFCFGQVQERHIPMVISTSTVPRKADILKACENCAVYTESDEGIGQLVAWAYLDFAGSLTTLYVQPEYRRKGLAKVVSTRLLRNAAGDEAGYVSYAHVHGDNVESRRVCEALGGRYLYDVWWVWVDLDKL